MSLTDGPNFHKAIKKANAEEALLANGGAEDTGKFLIRKSVDKSGEEKAIVSVIYKGKPTHHTVTISQEGGDLAINKSPTGATNLVELEDFLRTKRKFWPVPLTTAVPSGGGGGGGGGAASAAAPGTSKKKSGGAGGTLDSAFYHKKCTKAKADELLLADGGSAVSGKYLFRIKPKSEHAFILSVIYKGAATHHTMSRESDGAEFTLNNNPTGCTKLSEVEQKYASKQPKWPVPLKAGVPGHGGGGGGGGGGESAPTPAPAAAAAAPVPTKATAAPAGGGGGGGGGNDTDFLHGDIGKAKADELLLANGGEGKSGKFLFRAKKGGEGNAFFLSVMFNGKPTHHNITRDAPGAKLSLNKNPTGQTTLASLHNYLKTKQPKWPVPLKQGVSPSGGGGGGKSAAPAAAAAAPAVTATAPAASRSSDGHGEYFFDVMTKDGAEKLLLADGGAAKSGKYLFRGKASKGFISVIYKGKPTHHALVKAGAKYTLNKSPIDCKNLEEVANYLKTKQPKWPVPLTEGVTNPKRVGGGGGGGGGGGSGGGGGTPKVEYIEVEEEIEEEVEVDVTDDEATAAAGGGGGGGDGGPESDADFQFNHKKINKVRSEELLLANGGKSKTGKFLFRQKPKTTNDFLLSVIYKGQPTHHPCGFVDGAFELNKNPTKKETLYDLAAWLVKKQPKWPVPLTEGVTRKGYTGGGGGGGGGGKVYKKVKKMVKKKVIKKVAKGTGGWTAPATKSDGAGPLGFDDWDDPNGLDKAVELAARVGPVGKVEKRSFITKTWRRKKLQTLEDKPNSFGAWGNLLSDKQVNRMSSSGGGSMPVSSGKSKRPSLFQNDVESTFNINLSKSSQSRMSSSFMSFDNQSLGPNSGIYPDAAAGGQQECTFLGNCTCTDCL